MTKKLLYACCAFFALCQAVELRAQQALFHCTISGHSATTDSSGRIIDQPLNNQTLLSEYALSQGYTNTSWLDLAYHVGGSSFGDTIDVIVRTNGTVGHTLLGFYFGEDPTLGRAGLLSGSGRQQRRLEYIYTDQNTHSMGSALLTDYYWLDASGNTNNQAHFGQLAWIVVPDAVHGKVHVNSASMTTTGPYTFP